MLANGGWDLIQRLALILLKWTIWRAPTNASKWRMVFNSAFKGLKKLVCKGVNWIHLAQDRDSCCAHVRAVINFNSDTGVEILD